MASHRFEGDILGDPSRKDRGADWFVYHVGTEIMGKDVEHVVGFHFVPTKWGEYELARLMEAHPRQPIVRASTCLTMPLHTSALDLYPCIALRTSLALILMHS